MNSARHMGIALLLAAVSQTPALAHNGAVGLAMPVASVLGKGSTFTVILPAEWRGLEKEG